MKVKKIITIEKEQFEWLAEHPEINFSGLCRKAIEAIRLSINN